jgi:hypothetical protein
VSIWQLFACNFSPTQYQYLQPFCQKDILYNDFLGQPSDPEWPPTRDLPLFGLIDFMI